MLRDLDKNEKKPGIKISATYICPDRGLGNLQPPEGERLGQATKVAKNLGIERLILPVLEESLLGTGRSRVQYLDGLIRALDRVEEGGLRAWLIAPAQRVLGLDFAPPHLVRGVKDPKAGPVFVDGRIRNLWPFNWWADPPLIQKRIKIFRELVRAVAGHPAVEGWVVMDRALEWARPDPEAADLVLKSYLGEIRDRDEDGNVFLGLGWKELLDPELARALTGQVDGLRMSGLEDRLAGLKRAEDLAMEILMVAYLVSLAKWLFARPTEVEVGWGMLEGAGEMEEIVGATGRLAAQSVEGLHWLSLVDPEPGLRARPPWVLRPGLEGVGLLDVGLEPKGHVEPWLNGVRSSGSGPRGLDFIDIDLEEYLEDPKMHLSRLWDHFREGS